MYVEEFYDSYIFKDFLDICVPHTDQSSGLFF